MELWWRWMERGVWVMGEGREWVWCGGSRRRAVAGSSGRRRRRGAASSVLALPKVEPARTRERDRVSVARATAKGKRWKRCRKQGGTGARAVGVSVQARDAMPVARGAGAAHLTPGATC